MLVHTYYMREKKGCYAYLRYLIYEERARVTLGIVLRRALRWHAIKTAKVHLTSSSARCRLCRCWAAGFH